MRSVPDSWWIKWVWKGNTSTPLNEPGAEIVVEEKSESNHRNYGTLKEKEFRIMTA
jgi:hypothetical protein